MTVFADQFNLFMLRFIVGFPKHEEQDLATP